MAKRRAAARRTSVSRVRDADARSHRRDVSAIMTIADHGARGHSRAAGRACDTFEPMPQVARRLGTLIALILALAAPPALAQGNFEIQVYGSELTAPARR